MDPKTTKIRDVAAKASNWAKSAEGKNSIQKAFENAEKTRNQIKESMKIDPSRLHEPITL